MSRNKKTGINKDAQYKKVFEERGVNKIRQYRTPVLNEIPETITTFDYIWKYGDTFWRLAHRFFQNKNYWYVIAQANNKPTESHVKIGEKIKIPVDIYEILQVLK